MPDPAPLLPLLSLRSTGWSQVLRSGESLSLQMFSANNVQPGSSAHAPWEHLGFCVTHADKSGLKKKFSSSSSMPCASARVSTRDV